MAGRPPFTWLHGTDSLVDASLTGGWCDFRTERLRTTPLWCGASVVVPMNKTVCPKRLTCWQYDWARDNNELTCLDFLFASCEVLHGYSRGHVSGLPGAVLIPHRDPLDVSSTMLLGLRVCVSWSEPRGVLWVMCTDSRVVKCLDRSKTSSSKGA